MKVYIKAVVIALIVVGVFLLLVHNNTYEVLWEDIKEGIFQTQKKEPVVHLTSLFRGCCRFGNAGFL